MVDRLINGIWSTYFSFHFIVHLTVFFLADKKKSTICCCVCCVCCKVVCLGCVLLHLVTFNKVLFPWCNHTQPFASLTHLQTLPTTVFNKLQAFENLVKPNTRLALNIATINKFTIAFRVNLYSSDSMSFTTTNFITVAQT